MRRIVLAAAALLALSVPAAAAICAVDDVPAATLLLPYFEVDLEDVNGIQTLFSINNASATAVLTHVVVWSDLSVPVLDFNLYLTGYDVQTINLRDVIVNGVLPRSASAGQDPSDTISPQGAFSQDINFASCSGLLPPPNLPPSFVTHLRRSLTGLSSDVLAGLCAGRSLGDSIARGYVTVDTVDACNLLFPGDSGYFGPAGTGVATNQNVIWGDYLIDDSRQNLAQGDTLVHVEASPGVGSGASNTYPAPGSPDTVVPGQYTFYGRYVGWNATDNREPLASSFATRFANGGGFDGGTSYLVWRDSKVNQTPFACPVLPGVRPAWYPLGQEGVAIFDEQETPLLPETFPFSPQPPNEGILPFPAEAQRTVVGGVDLPVPFAFGWMVLDLNTTVAAASGNPPEDPAAAQAWVVTVMDASGRFSIGYGAIQLDSACAASHSVPGPAVAFTAPR